MKNLVMIALISLLATRSFAGNDGPQATPMPQPAVPDIAQYSVSIGFQSNPNMPFAVSISVNAEGRVRYTEHFRPGRVVNKEVAVLSKELTARLKASVAAIKPGKMVDPSPNDPGCYDAPTVTYQAIQASGERITLAQTHRCKGYEKENATDADKAVVEALNSLKDLAHL